LADCASLIAQCYTNITPPLPPLPNPPPSSLQENEVRMKEGGVDGIAKTCSEVSLLKDESGASFRKEVERVTYEVARGDVALGAFLETENIDWMGAGKISVQGSLVVNEGYVRMEEARVEKARTEAGEGGEEKEGEEKKEVVKKPPVSFDVTVELNRVEEFLPQPEVEMVPEEAEEA